VKEKDGNQQIYRCVGGHFSEFNVFKCLCAIQSNQSVSNFHPRVPNSILNHSLRYSESFLLNSIFKTIDYYRKIMKKEERFFCLIGAPATFISYFPYLFGNVIYLPLQFSLTVHSELEIRKILEFSFAFGISAQAHISLLNDSLHHQWEALVTFKFESIPQHYISFLNENSNVIQEFIWISASNSVEFQSKSYQCSKDIYLSFPLPTMKTQKKEGKQEEEEENGKQEKNGEKKKNSKEIKIDWKTIQSCLSDLDVSSIQQTELKETCHVDFGTANKLSNFCEIVKSHRKSSKDSHLILQFDSYDSMNLITQLFANQFFQLNQIKPKGIVFLIDFTSQPLFELMNGYFPVSIDSKQFASKELFHSLHQFFNFISCSEPKAFVSESLMNVKTLTRNYSPGIEVFVPISRQHEGIATRIEERIKQSHSTHFKLNDISKDFWTREDFYISKEVCEGYVKFVLEFNAAVVEKQSNTFSEWNKKTKKLEMKDISKILNGCSLFKGEINVLN